MAQEQVTPLKSDSASIKVGDVFTRFSVGKVVEVGFGQVRVKNTEGLVWTITPELIEREFLFADHDYMSEPEKINRTEMIEILKSHPRTAMRIVYDKKLDPKNVALTLEAGRSTGETERQWQSRVKKALEGESRIMCGYHSSQFDPHQRLYFTEIDGKDGMSGCRLVDVRTLRELTVGGRRYVLK